MTEDKSMSLTTLATKTLRYTPALTLLYNLKKTYAMYTEMEFPQLIRIQGCCTVIDPELYTYFLAL